MVERWLVALIVVVAGLLLGAVVGWFVRRRLVRSHTEATSTIAGVAGLFAFSFVTLVSVLIAVSLVEPTTLEDLPREVLGYTPRLLVAGLIMLAGYVIAIGAARLVAFGTERASGRQVARFSTFVRWAVLLATGLLALAQLGIDTTALLLILGVGGFGLALGAGLLIGLGGRQVAAEVAAGRYLARRLKVGTLIEWDGSSGTISALHPAGLELDLGEGSVRLVPYTALLAAGVTLHRPPNDDA